MNVKKYERMTIDELIRVLKGRRSIKFPLKKALVKLAEEGE